MAEETRRLADFAVSLAFEDIPKDVIHRAKQCFADTIAAATYGARLPWSRIIAAYARHAGPNGPCHIAGSPGAKVQAGAAALANGASAHAFELDTLRRPGAGVHPGATLVPAALALAQERKLTGREILTALVAGCEVQFRIGKASRHSSEKRGFHAPGLTGPLGAAVVSGRLLGLDKEAMTNALGIAGSLSSGLLEFAASGNGGMVKRLHLGRAAESGVIAASLARDGFTGPATVLEGEYGFLRVFCAESEPRLLTSALGEKWETRNICFKRYPCHITAHTAIEAVLATRSDVGFGIEDIDAILIRGNEKMVRLHNIQAPKHLIMAQYSIPWCVAAALVHDPRDPETFGEVAFSSQIVMALSARISVDASAPPHISAWGCVASVRLRNGKTVDREMDDFPGTPTRPLSDEELREKFLSLTGRTPAADHNFGRLVQLETENDVDWIAAPSTE